MSEGPFHPSFEELPARLPVFPLTGVLLLPHGRLPLNIFEPRYLAMTSHGLAQGRMVGMIQPLDGHGDAGDPPLYRTGCMGRIIEFRETEDGRFLVTLAGVCRFDVIDELPRQELFRTVVPDWNRWRTDLADSDPQIDRDRLAAALKPFFKRHEINADFSAIAASPADRLVTSLAMICPFSPREKQALLETQDASARAELLTALLEMSMLGGLDDGESSRH